MDIEQLIGSVVRGALSGKRKKRRGAARYLSGGRGSFLSGSTLLAMAGLAWGVYETVTKKDPVYAGPGPQAPGASPPPANQVATPVPPLPVVGPEVPADVVRLVRLVIAAARADGSLDAGEQEAILEHARAVGAESIVARELSSSFTLAQIVAGVTDAARREELYTIAFAIVRGDEQVTGGERIFLAQLASLLGLDPAATARLEQQAAARIDAAAREDE